jgi:microcystin-dependent protein
MTLFKWSRTAATNATADSTCPFPEGMAPSALNDGTRGMMAAVSKYRDDIAGAIVTAGTSTAYTVASYEGYDTLANLNGQMIAFTPNVTNGDTVTLNVDGLGAKPLRSAPSTEIVAGTLIQGTPYVAVYNNSDGSFYLQGFFSSPYNVPFLGGMDFWDTVTPNSSFIFPAGQAISRSVYSKAFARWGTTYGAGDGSTTFNVPDKTERVSVMKAAAASRLTATYFGGNSTVMGATGGVESATAPLPAHTHTGTTGNDSPDHTHTVASAAQNGVTYASSGGAGVGAQNSTPTTSGASTRHQHPFTTDSAGSGGAHNNVQPSIVCNYILRII